MSEKFIDKKLKYLLWKDEQVVYIDKPKYSFFENLFKNCKFELSILVLYSIWTFIVAFIWFFTKGATNSLHRPFLIWLFILYIIADIVYRIFYRKYTYYVVTNKRVILLCKNIYETCNYILYNNLSARLINSKKKRKTQDIIIKKQYSNGTKKEIKFHHLEDADYMLKIISGIITSKKRYFIGCKNNTNIIEKIKLETHKKMQKEI